MENHPPDQGPKPEIPDIKPESPQSETPAEKPNPLSEFLNREVSRRDALKISVATVIATANAVLFKSLLDKLGSNNRPQATTHTGESTHSSEPAKTPEVTKGGIEFGFNTHLDNEASNMNLELFRKCVEDLSSRGQKWIRFNLKGESIHNSDVMSDFDQGLDFAKQKGLKVALVTNPPDLSEESIASSYVELAERFRGKVDVWQIFNEANAHHFRDYSPRPKVTDEYLREFSQAVGTASQAIKSVDSGAKTTVNLSAWVGDHRDVVEESKKFFGSVIKDIDIVSLDLYPDGNEEEIAKYPSYVASINQALGKDVMIPEIGWPTYENGFTPQDQAKYMGQVMSALHSGSIKPTAVLFYEWADEQGIGENAFGANDIDGNPKDSNSYQQLAEALSPPTARS